MIDEQRIISIVCLLITAVPAIWFAEKSSRTKVFYTLKRTKAEVLPREGVASVKINHSAESLDILLSDGFTFDVSMAGLHSALAGVKGETAKRAAVAQFVDEFMAMVTLPKLSAETLEFLYPVIAAANPLSVQRMQQLDGACRQEVAPGLASYLVLRRGVREAYLTEARISEAGFVEADLRDLAIANLRRSLEQLKFDEVSGNPWIAQIEMDGLLNVGLMLLPEVWDDLTTTHGPVAVACPEYGTLVVAEAGSAEGMRFLRQCSADLREKSAFPISYGIYGWQNGAWKPLP